MIEIKKDEEIEEIIKTNRAVLVYISTPQCNVCKILKPKISDLIKSEFSQVKMCYVDSELLPSFSAQNQIFTVPTILVFIEGKELLRKSRNINLAEFYNDLSRPYQMIFSN